jgi:hypothetical protein
LAGKTGKSRDGMKSGPDHNRIPVDCHGLAELVTRLAIRGAQLGCFGCRCPAARRLYKHIGETGISKWCAITTGTDDDRVAINGDGEAEFISFRCSRSGQLGRFGCRCPAARRLHKDICLAGKTGKSRRSIKWGSNHNRIPADRDSSAEFITRRAVRGGQPGGLQPDPAQFFVYIGRPGSDSVHRIGITRGADDDRIPAHRHGEAKVVKIGSAGGGQLHLGEEQRIDRDRIDRPGIRYLNGNRPGHQGEFGRKRSPRGVKGKQFLKTQHPASLSIRKNDRLALLAPGGGQIPADRHLHHQRLILSAWIARGR